MKLVHIVAGPNGAGKTTNCRRLLEGEPVETYLNNDLLALGLNQLYPEKAMREATRLFLARFEELARQGASFAFETNLAGRGVLQRTKNLVSRGYTVRLTYLTPGDLGTCLERVRRRKATGGHGVDEDIIARRFASGPAALFRDFVPLCASWRITLSLPQFHLEPVAQGGQDAKTDVLAADAYEKIRALAANQLA